MLRKLVTRVLPFPASDVRDEAILLMSDRLVRISEFQVNAVVVRLSFGVFKVRNDMFFLFHDILDPRTPCGVLIRAIRAVFSVPIQAGYSHKKRGPPTLREMKTLFSFDRGHIFAQVLTHLVPPERDRGKGARRCVDGPLIVLARCEHVAVSMHPVTLEVQTVHIEVVLAAKPVSVCDIVKVEDPASCRAVVVVPRIML